MSIDIKANRAICDAATPGPWATNDHVVSEDCIYVESETDGVATVFCGDDYAQERANAAFIAHARTALPAALDEIARLRAFRVSLGAWTETYENEAQSFLASSGLAPHVHAFHRGRVKAMEELLSFLEDFDSGTAINFSQPPTSRGQGSVDE